MILSTEVLARITTESEVIADHEDIIDAEEPEDIANAITNLLKGIN